MKKDGSTAPYTAGMLALGGINFFFHPGICAMMLSGYIIALTVDLAKTLAVLKYGVKPLWKFHMSDVGFLANCVFGAVAAQAVTRAGIKRLRESLNRAVVLRQGPSKRD